MGFLHLLTHQVDWTQIKCHPCWEDFLDPSGWTEGGSFFPKLWNWDCVTQLPLAIPPYVGYLFDSTSFGIKKSQV